MKKSKFELKEEHLMLLENMYIDSFDGQPILDRKRPFGNSYIERDIIEIVDYEKYEFAIEENDGELLKQDLELAKKLLSELHIAMAIVLQHGREIGNYENDGYGKKWRLSK
jgi:hypothetical protein